MQQQAGSIDILKTVNEVKTEVKETATKVAVGAVGRIVQAIRTKCAELYRSVLAKMNSCLSKSDNRLSPSQV